MAAKPEHEALKGRELKIAVNGDDVMAKHKSIVGTQVRTRFPPEPNGYLHIGHAKSMNMNFQMAFEKLDVDAADRYVYFRYDDTNPEAESKEYIDSLAEDVKWMGWRPNKVTYSSEYFTELHDLAVELIKRGKAYVCHQTGPEIEKCREVAKNRALARNAGKVMPEGQHESPYRNRSVEENLKLFSDMRRGLYAEGEAALRMKMDMDSNNYNMYDCVAYRIKYVPHPHVGEGWCIYPSYDFTHCIIDSLEEIEYSICTLEFETRRESYYWLLDALDLYKPKVYEFARLNITNTVLSKRKLLKLVMNGYMAGWDDPRMPTIKGLRRLGLTSEIINAFCVDVGVTRNMTSIASSKLDHFARLYLNPISPRRMCVLDPIKLIIDNMPAGGKTLEIPHYPQDKARSNETMAVTMSKEVWIDRRDFREEAPDDYFGLTLGGVVGLMSAFTMKYVSIKRDAAGAIEAVHVVADFEKTIKPRTWVHWASVDSAEEVEVRLYDKLFTVEEPSKDWEAELNPKSKVVVKGYGMGLSEGAVVGASFQFQREGYFTVDPDTKGGHIVFNRTTGLVASGLKKKEASSEQAAANAKRKADMQANVKAKEAQKRMDPKDMFKSQTDKYSQFDESGVPTHDAAGAKLSKNALKKVKKESDKQKKTFEAWKASQ